MAISAEMMRASGDRFAMGGCNSCRNCRISGNTSARNTAPVIVPFLCLPLQLLSWDLVQPHLLSLERLQRVSVVQVVGKYSEAEVPWPLSNGRCTMSCTCQVAVMERGHAPCMLVVRAEAQFASLPIVPQVNVAITIRVLDGVAEPFAIGLQRFLLRC